MQAYEADARPDLLAFQMDKTRVATLMLKSDLSQMTFKFLLDRFGDSDRRLTGLLSDAA